MVTTNQQAAAVTQSSQQSTREQRQAAQDAANKAAAEAFEKASQPSGGALGTGGYGAPRTDSTRVPTNIDLSSPPGRALYEAYKESGVIFDSRTGNVIYNPADLGSREVEVARAAQGLPPSFKTTGEVSTSYSYNVAKESAGQVTQLRSQFEQLQKEKALSQKTIEQTKANIAQLQPQVDAALRDKSMNPKTVDNLITSLRAEERQLKQYERDLPRIENAIRETAKAEMAAKKKETISRIQFIEEAGRVSSGPIPVKNAFGATSSQVLPKEPIKTQRQRPQAITGVKEKLFASPTFMQDADTYTRPPSFLGETRKERAKIQTGVKEKLFASPAFVSYEEQKQKDLARTLGATKTDYTISLTEGDVSTPRPKAFGISLSEGKPREPRKLSQAQVDAMTPEQDAIYKAEFDAYNRYIEQQNKSIKEQNTKNLNEYLRGLKTFIDEEKAKGTKSIVVVTESGEKRIPIGQAYLGIQRIKDIKSIYTDTVIPQGYTVAGTIANPVFVPERPIIPKEAEKQDILSKALRGLEEYKAVVGPTGPRPQSEASVFYKEAAAGTLLQIGSTAAFLARGAIGVKNFLTTPTKPISNILQTEREAPYIPETPPNVVIGGPISGIISGEKDLGKKSTETKLVELKQKLGEGKYAGTLVGAGIELINPFKAAKVVKESFGEIKAKIKPITVKKPELETITTTLAKRQGTEILEPIKAYPQAKLRNLGFEERPEITAGIKPKEEKGLRKAFEIPEPFVKETGIVQGRVPRIPERETLEASEIIRNLEKKRLESIPGAKPVEVDPLYRPGVELRRAPEPKTFRVDETAMFGQDTAKGSQFAKEEVKLGIGIGGEAQPSKGPLGGTIIKEEITRAYKPQTIPLGASVKTVTAIPLGKGKAKTITPFGEKISVPLGEGKVTELDVRRIVPRAEPLIQIKPLKDLERGRTTLDESRAQIAKLEAQRLESIKGRPVEEVFGYNPAEFIPKMRAKEIKTYRVQSKELLGKTENPLQNIYTRSAEPLIKEGANVKPGLKTITKKAELEKEFPQLLQKKAFERSAAYAESVRVEYPFVSTEQRLGIGTGKKYVVTRPPKGFTQDLSDIGRGKGFYVSRETGEAGLKRFTPPKPPAEDFGKGKQQLILEKPQKQFQAQKVKLGKAKVIIAGAGATTAPAVPLAGVKASAEQFVNGTQTNQTGTNQTEAIPIEIIQEAPSELEPETITEQRPIPKFAAAQTTRSGLSYGLNALNSRRSAQGIQVSPRQGQKERELFAFGAPSGQPARQKQPAAFKQPQKQTPRFASPSPQPITPRLETPTPFPFKQPQLLIPRPRPKLLGAPKFAPPIKTPKRGRGKKIKGNVFLGNASEEEIALSFNRTEILTGSKRVQRQLKKDIEITREITGRGLDKLITQKTGSVLSKKKQSVLYREKPKDVLRQKKRLVGSFDSHP